MFGECSYGIPLSMKVMLFMKVSDRRTGKGKNQGNGETEYLRYSGRRARKRHSGRGLAAVLELS